MDFSLLGERNLMREYDLSRVFDNCQKSSSHAYDLARDHYKHLEKTIINAEYKIANTRKRLFNSPFSVTDAAEILSGQLGTIQSSFTDLATRFLDDLESIHQNKDPFTIVLFGRTKAGKSTLSEVLREGDGSTIGKGGQRTTLEPEPYYWNGLKIIDVPGIDAYGGREDELIAMDATVTADLILYIISDDSPGKADASFVSRLVNTGKPLILIFNVKAGINTNRPERSITEINQAFDLNRLDTMKDGFLKYAPIYGQDWSNIPVLYVHLMAAFIATNKRLEPSLAEAYEKASRINWFYSRLINEVRTKGEYLKTRTYIDAITVPLLNTIDILLFQAQENSFQGKRVNNTARELLNWSRDYRTNAISRIESFTDSIRRELYKEAAAFAEDHFADEKADDAWQEIVEKYNISDKYSQLLETIDTECKTKIENEYRGLEVELAYLSPSFTDHSFNAHKILDIKKGINYGFMIAAGLCEIGKIVATTLGKGTARKLLGASSVFFFIAGETISLLLKPYSQKVDEARQYLQQQLEEWIDTTVEKLEHDLKQNLNTIIESRVKYPGNELKKLCNTIFKLADTQKDLAWDLCAHVMMLNKQIVTESLKSLGMEDYNTGIVSVGRIPGVQTVIMPDKQVVLPATFKKDLHRLSSEWIRIIPPTANKRTLIYKVLGKKAQTCRIGIEGKIKVAHISGLEISPEMKTNMKLAQQMVELSIIIDN